MIDHEIYNIEYQLLFSVGVCVFMNSPQVFGNKFLIIYSQVVFLTYYKSLLVKLRYKYEILFSFKVLNEFSNLGKNFMHIYYKYFMIYVH